MTKPDDICSDLVEAVGEMIDARAQVHDHTGVGIDASFDTLKDAHAKLKRVFHNVVGPH